MISIRGADDLNPVQLPGIKGEVYLIERQFGLDSRNVQEEFWKMVNEAFQAA